jgi:hypothetical protein
VVTRKIDPATGALAAATDPDAIFEYFLAEHLPAAHATDSLEEGDEGPKAVDIF